MRKILHPSQSEEIPETSEATWRCKIQRYNVIKKKSNRLGMYKLWKIAKLSLFFHPSLYSFSLPYGFTVFSRPWVA